jgi:hypothetical protein
MSRLGPHYLMQEGGGIHFNQTSQANKGAYISPG